jgi:hypothetical protein
LHLSPKKSTRPGLRAEPSWTTLSQALSPISAKNAAEPGEMVRTDATNPRKKAPEARNSVFPVYAG